MNVRNLMNGVVAEVDDELGRALIDSGTWEEVKAPVRRARKAASAAVEPAPVEEPSTEE